MKKQPDPSRPRVAIVHDWLTGIGGAERTVASLCRLFPEASLYTSVYLPDRTLPVFRQMSIRTSFLQWLPGLRSNHRLGLGFRWLHWRWLNLKDYDLVISSSGSEAKSVRTNPRQLHINLCYSPTHYYWSHYDQYLKRPDLGRGWNLLARLGLRLFIKLLRRLDYRAAQRPDRLVAISQEVSRRIKRYYDRPSQVIWPPVEPGTARTKQRSGYIVLGRHVSYKGFETAILACNRLGLELTVVGQGPCTKRLQKLAGPTVKFVGQVSEQRKFELLAQAEACLFPAEDDFGLVPVEAMSVGTPVIAYAAGGALDTVINGQTGLFFNQPSSRSLQLALRRFGRQTWSSRACRRQAARFSPARFQARFKDFVSQAWREHGR